jgi:4-hydroxythreonine-4-phosphate dehydrogenase
MPLPVPRIAITPGEPAGIGPDLIVGLAQQPSPAQRVIIANPAVLTERAAQLNLPLEIRPFDDTTPATPSAAGQIYNLPIPLQRSVQAGELDPGNAAHVLQTLERATEGCLKGQFDALVTGPVHKGNINAAGIGFTGHTEFLAQRSGVDHVVMMLVAKELRVALVTTHLPLADVPKAITPQRLARTLQILYQDLKDRFAMPTPRIAVCGLNPHAGEGGHLGNEEQSVIIPVLELFRHKGMNPRGPVPADTAFTREALADTDVVLAMYHDQGLPVIKHIGFGETVNITLGLPFIRTSVDHGTALDLAGTGRARHSSLEAAFDFALNMLRRQQA